MVIKTLKKSSIKNKGLFTTWKTTAKVLKNTYQKKNPFWGDTDSSTSILALIGLGAEVKIIPNLYVTGVLDYNLNLDNSGLSYDPSPLDLVSGENYTNFNVGLKYKF